MSEFLRFKEFYIIEDKDGHFTYSVPSLSINHNFEKVYKSDVCLRKMLKGIKSAESELKALKAVVNQQIAASSQFELFD